MFSPSFASRAFLQQTFALFESLCKFCGISPLGSWFSLELEELDVVNSVWLKSQHEVKTAFFAKFLGGIFTGGFASCVDRLDGVT